MGAQEQDKFIVRLPEGMRDQIKLAAEASGRSMNAEVVMRLQNSLELRDWIAGQAAGECFAQSLSHGRPVDIDEYTSRAAFWAYRLADAMLEARNK